MSARLLLTLPPMMALPYLLFSGFDDLKTAGYVFAGTFVVLGIMKLAKVRRPK